MNDWSPRDQRSLAWVVGVITLFNAILAAAVWM